jgi:hypothetical protein
VVELPVDHMDMTVEDQRVAVQVTRALGNLRLCQEHRSKEK